MQCRKIAAAFALAAGCASGTNPPSSSAPPDALTSRVQTSSAGASEPGSPTDATASGAGSNGIADPSERGTEPAHAQPAAGSGRFERNAEPADVEPAVGAGRAESAAESARSEPKESAKKSPALPSPVHNNVDDSCGKDPGVGQQLKAFSLESTDGKTVSEADFRGRVTLVNFWGTWCKPCLEELPQFDRLYRRYRKHGLSFVAIATDEDPAPVAAFGKRRKIAAKLLVGGEEYANFYKSPKFPFSFVVDPSGKIVASFRGYEHKCMGKVEAELRKQLEQRAAKKR